jgi:hypothetical protein
VSLTAVPDHANLFALQGVNRGILFIKKRCHLANFLSLNINFVPFYAYILVRYNKKEELSTFIFLNADRCKETAGTTKHSVLLGFALRIDEKFTQKNPKNRVAKGVSVSAS